MQAAPLVRSLVHCRGVELISHKVTLSLQDTPLVRSLVRCRVVELISHKVALSLQATPLVKSLVHCRGVELIREGLLYMNNYSQINAIIENKFNRIVDT